MANPSHNDIQTLRRLIAAGDTKALERYAKATAQQKDKSTPRPKA
jgi:hypothetical protein